MEKLKKIIPEISKIQKKYKEKIEELEIAYIGARYLPIEYSKEKVKKLLKVVKEILNFSKNMIKPIDIAISSYLKRKNTLKTI